MSDLGIDDVSKNLNSCLNDLKKLLTAIDLICLPSGETQSVSATPKRIFKPKNTKRTISYHAYSFIEPVVVAERSI